MRSSLLLLAGMAIGATLSSAQAGERVESMYRQLAVLAEALAYIDEHYIHDVPAPHLIRGAIDGMVGSLDPHSAFFPAARYQELRDVAEGEYTGVGIEIGFRRGRPEILSIRDDSPAYRAGLAAGDFILQIDTADTRGMSYDSLRQRLRGPIGTRVTLLIQRPNRDDPWEHTLIRSWVRIPTLTSRPLADNIHYVKISTFSREVVSDLKSHLTLEPSPAGLMIDLRGNPGGLFDEAITLADLFLEKGIIVRTMGRSGQLFTERHARKPGTQPSYPLAILIDRSSASSAEIVAAALQDNQRARLFGQRSYGKGTVQSIADLSDGSGLKITVAHYLTPENKNIEGFGIEPDVDLTGADDASVINTALQWIQSELR